MEDTQLYTIIGTVAGMISLYMLNRYQAPKTEHFITTETLSDVNSRLTKVETNMNLFMKVIESKLIDAFHSPHTPEIDVLLEKLKNNPKSMSKDDIRELKERIEAELEKIDPKSPIYLTGVLLTASLECKLN